MNNWIVYNEESNFKERDKIPINTPILTRLFIHYGHGDNELDYRVMSFNELYTWDLLDKNETVTHWQKFDKI